MSELYDFAAKLIELEGGAVELHAERIEALLPSKLSNAWQVADELVLSETDGAAHRLMYGSELLERMLDTATLEIALAAGRLELPPPRAAQIKTAAERWSLRNGLVTVGDIRVCSSARAQLFVLGTLHGDEKREFLLSTVIAPWSGTEVPGFIEACLGAELSAHREPVSCDELTLSAGMLACEQRALTQTHAFREGMTRRFERDRERIDVYFAELSRELDKRERKGKLDPEAVADKRRAQLADRAAKLEALAARFVLRIELVPVALRLLDVDSGFVTLALRRRKASRQLDLEYDVATRQLIAPRCDACASAAARPAVCDDAMHILCEQCAPRAEGRIACPACKRAVKHQAPTAAPSSQLSP
jgi:hypothetical protein